MSRPHPILIQGGMGIAISDWKLARSVSLLGQLGVVSGTAIATVFIRRLQDGDLDINANLSHLQLIRDIKRVCFLRLRC